VTGALHLRNGVLIDDPLGTVRQFVDTYGMAYDDADVAPNVVEESDIALANKIIARMGKDAKAALLSRKSEIEAALILIPLDATLTVPADKVPWEALGQLYRSVERLAHIGLPRATKVLHKKRPALIPILDDVVKSYLTSVDGPVSKTQEGIELTRRYHVEVHHSLRVLHDVRDALANEDGINLTECRLLDIYLWAYSGTYEPRELRNSAGPVNSDRPRVSGVKSAEDSRLPNEVMRFRGDGDSQAFCEWRDNHPRSYIVNTNRPPSASYLKLHRASCPHMNRSGVKSWTASYEKLCSLEAHSLVRWCIETLRTEPDRCPVCSP
jgi:hypothetical protein